MFDAYLFMSLGLGKGQILWTEQLAFFNSVRITYFLYAYDTDQRFITEHSRLISVLFFVCQEPPLTISNIVVCHKEYWNEALEKGFEEWIVIQ